jgi:MoxR-like ATPase
VTTTSALPAGSTDLDLAERLAEARRRILEELHKVIVGQEEVIDQVLFTLFGGGHSLIIGVPGLAKTLLVQTTARALDLKFSRIQFTPDLMPSDITGTDLVQEDPATGRRELNFLPGPVFGNIVLADEVNRTPPKTQAALLEAMQEHKVTVQGRTYQLPEPFFVFATQNPIELEGTYPLPEAQLDRFMFSIPIEYSDERDEVAIVQGTTGAPPEAVRTVVSGPELLAFQDLVRRVPAADEVVRYAVQLVRASRPDRPESLEFVRRWLNYGASVRAAQYLVLGGKARALLSGRHHANFDDVRALARPVLRHRLLRNFHAESERVDTDTIVAKLVETVPVPRSGM